MLQVCIDDSRTEPNQGPVFVLAGFVGRVQNLEALADDWQRLLLKKPKIAYLKGKKAYWLEQRDVEGRKRVLEFVALITKYKLGGVRLTVSHDGFEQHLGAFGNHHLLRNPAYTAVSAVTCAVLGAAHRSPTREKLQLIFDENVVSRPELESGNRSLRARIPKRVIELLAHEPKFEDDKEFLPLQAADLYAYYVGTDVLLRSTGQRMESPVWDALSQIPFIDASIDDADLRAVHGDIIAAIKGRFKKL